MCHSAEKPEESEEVNTHKDVCSQSSYMLLGGYILFLTWVVQSFQESEQKLLGVVCCC